MKNYDEMTIPELEAESKRIHDTIREGWKEMGMAHAVAERKRRALPVSATANDQVIQPNPNIIDQLKALPPALFEQAKQFFAKGEK